MTENSTPLAPETVTLAELIDLTGEADRRDVEIHVLVDLGYDQPFPLPVTGVYATTYRNGSVVIVLDAT